jgi:hypothetical protein
MKLPADILFDAYDHLERAKDSCRLTHPPIDWHSPAHTRQHCPHCKDMADAQYTIWWKAIDAAKAEKPDPKLLRAIKLRFQYAS